jgi:hypothetical protein
LITGINGANVLIFCRKYDDGPIPNIHYHLNLLLGELDGPLLYLVVVQRLALLCRKTWIDIDDHPIALGLHNYKHLGGCWLQFRAKRFGREPVAHELATSFGACLVDGTATFAGRAVNAPLPGWLRKFSNMDWR